MALEEYTNVPPEWERRKRHGVAEADVGRVIPANVSVPHGMHSCFHSGRRRPTQMDPAQKELRTTSSSMSPVEESSYSLYDGLRRHPMSPCPADHCETRQELSAYNSTHRAGANKSSSISECSDHEARAVGHGRPRSVSQPLPAKAVSPPLYFRQTESSQTNDGFLRQYHFGVVDSHVPEIGRQSWDERAYQTQFLAEGVKTTGGDRFLITHGHSCSDAHQFNATVHNSGTRNPSTSKQRTRLRSIPLEAFNSELMFQNDHCCTTNNSSQDLDPGTDFPASTISKFGIPETCAPAQNRNGYSSSHDYGELCDDVFNLSLYSGLSKERVGSKASRLQSIDQEKILREFASSSVPLGLREVAEAVGSAKIHEVKSLLDKLTSEGILNFVQSQPPQWIWSRGRRRKVNPGVIGEEKKQREYSRRSPHLNECDEKLRNFSSRRDEGYPQFCNICKVSLSTEEQAAEHVTSNKHRNKLSKYKHPTFCDYCKVNLNSESQALEHFNSGRHEQTVAKSQKAPVKIHPPLVTVKQNMTPICNTVTTPEGYHIELYQKAMRTNGVYFLPTGTGKNLVSALVIAHTLHLNPTRQIIFLVDRVLLVLQQSDYLKKELGHLKVQLPQVCVPSPRGVIQPTVAERPIRIGAVCGEMRKLDGQTPIFEHDVLVITADCYRNHLTNRTLRVEDVSLIVLDEAHHCNKDHPYNVIMREHYLHESGLLYKPKVLGLTTSTAGESSLDRTTKKMQRLLSNLGNAAMLTVTSRVWELEQRTSQTKPLCFAVDYTQTEKYLLDVLVEYATKCFNQAVRLSELKNYKEIFQPSAGSFLGKEDIFPILGVVDSILLHSSPDGDAYCSLLHFQVICEAICSLQECGAKVALEGLSCLRDAGPSHGLDWALMKGLPWNRIRSFLELYHLRGHPNFEDLKEMDSGVQKLLEQLLGVNWDRPLTPRPLALVLVKRPRTACSLTKYLSDLQELVQRCVRVACGVTSAGGVLDIRDKVCHVVVTTSVTGEGLDLSECEMVIQMDPPCPVTALSQIRSRAWKPETRMIAVCRDEEHSRKNQELLKREENMRRATYDISLC